jgi:hypothetical protein
MHSYSVPSYKRKSFLTSLNKKTLFSFAYMHITVHYFIYLPQLGTVATV